MERLRREGNGSANRSMTVSPGLLILQKSAMLQNRRYDLSRATLRSILERIIRYPLLFHMLLRSTIRPRTLDFQRVNKHLHDLRTPTPRSIINRTTRRTIEVHSLRISTPLEQPPHDGHVPTKCRTHERRILHCILRVDSHAPDLHERFHDRKMTPPRCGM